MDIFRCYVNGFGTADKYTNTEEKFNNNNNRKGGANASCQRGYLPTVGLSADVLLLIVDMSVLAECADINKGLAAVLVAAEEKDLRGGFRLGHFGVVLYI